MKKPVLLHVGKCGGSSFLQVFKKKYGIFIPQFHSAAAIQDGNLKQPKDRISFALSPGEWTQVSVDEIIKTENLIILVRCPVSRFLSVFFHRKKINQREIGENYKSFRNFKSPTELGEALDPRSEKWGEVSELMDNFSHMRMSLSSYLPPAIIKKDKDSFFKKIFGVIRQEHYNSDLLKIEKRICNKLNIKFVESTYVKKNSTKEFDELKILSPKALENIKDFYKKDYKTLSLLKEIGVISKDYLDSLK